MEIKRIGTIDAVEQLLRYLERIRLDPARLPRGARRRRIAANGPLALDASKRILQRPGRLSPEGPRAWQRQGEIAGPVFGSEDAREGATAFATAGRRLPSFVKLD